MAKRHHDNHKDYGRRMEHMEREGMIHEDRSAIANLPQHPMIKMYPKCDYMPEVLDDTIRGVDRQIDLDNSKRRSHFMPKKV